MALSVVLAACVAAPPQRVVVQGPPAPPPIVVYPANGQSPQQLDRDRYECHLWAVQQSGFDPSRAGVPPGERVVVAIHRAGKAEGAAPATLDVKLGMTWAEGCKLGDAAMQSGGATATVDGGTLHLQATGDAVWMGSCE